MTKGKDLLAEMEAACRECYYGQWHRSAKQNLTRTVANGRTRLTIFRQHRFRRLVYRVAVAGPDGVEYLPDSFESEAEACFEIRELIDMLEADNETQNEQCYQERLDPTA